MILGMLLQVLYYSGCCLVTYYDSGVRGFDQYVDAPRLRICLLLLNYPFYIYHIYQQRQDYPTCCLVVHWRGCSTWGIWSYGWWGWRWWRQWWWLWYKGMETIFSNEEYHFYILSSFWVCFDIFLFPLWNRRTRELLEGKGNRENDLQSASSSEVMHIECQ